eukprot:SAG11_NODE_38295_length_253_cov_0.558442_1_plen_58_part_10
MFSHGSQVLAHWPPSGEGFDPNWSTEGMSDTRWYKATVIKVHLADVRHQQPRRYTLKY